MASIFNSLIDAKYSDSETCVELLKPNGGSPVSLYGSLSEGSAPPLTPSKVLETAHLDVSEVQQRKNEIKIRALIALFLIPFLYGIYLIGKCLSEYLDCKDSEALVMEKALPYIVPLIEISLKKGLEQIKQKTGEASSLIPKSTSIKIAKFIIRHYGEEGYFKRSKHSSLPRTINMRPNGDVYLHLNASSRGDILLGRGGQSQAKFVINLVNGDVLVGLSSISLSNPTREEKTKSVEDRLKGKDGFVQTIDRDTFTSQRGFDKSLSYKTWYQGKDLSNAMEKLPLPKKIVIAKKLLVLLQELHEMGIAHRDIKPENIFLDEKGNPFFGDFGLAEESTSWDFHVCGTAAYAAPELFTDKVLTFEDLKKADVFAMGTTLKNLFQKEFDAARFSSNPSWKNAAEIERFIDAKMLHGKISPRFSAKEAWDRLSCLL